MKPSVEKAAVPRLDTIDFLRGVSILAVVLLHLRILLGFSGVKIGSSLPKWLAYLLFSNGNNGVSVFFAVSGFLITLTSLKRFGCLSQLRPRVFYRIRFARIAPLLLFLLAVLSALHLAHVQHFEISPSVSSLPRALFAAISFHINLLEAVHGYLPPSWDILWSLSIEEMFYFFFPLVCFLMPRWRWGKLGFVILLLAFAVVGPFARTVLSSNEIWQEKSYLACMDGIALGCLCALLTERWQRLDYRPAWLGALQTLGGLMILFMAVWPWPRVPAVVHFKSLIGRSGIDVTVLTLGTCFVMLSAVLRRSKGFLWTYPVRWLGRYSYEVYLTHEFVVIAVCLLYLKVNRGTLLLWAAVALLLSAMLGAVVAKCLSEPLNRLLRGGPLPTDPKALPARS